MTTYPYENLDAQGRRRSKWLDSIDNTAKAAGFTDRVVDNENYNRTLKRFGVLVTSAFGTNGATVQLGTAASAGAYASAVVPVTAAAGDFITGTIASADIPGNVTTVLDQAVASGNGAYRVVMEFEYDPD